MPYLCGMRKYKEYTDEQIISYSKDVKSIAGLLRKLGLRCAGGNYANMKRTIQKLNVNTDHWTGQAWNKDEKLKDWSEYARVCTFKKHLIKLRGHKCEKCQLSEWLFLPIPLEVHHKDGNRTNNTLDNLELLCNNCHGLTDTWRNRKCFNAGVAKLADAADPRKREGALGFESQI